MNKKYAIYEIGQYVFRGNQESALKARAPDAHLIAVCEGGHQRFPAELKRLCSDSGFAAVRIGSTTYERTVWAIVKSDTPGIVKI
jgi:hypothetical protein